MRPGLWPAEVIPRCEMVRADRASRHHVLPSSSATFGTPRSERLFSSSHFGVQNGAPRRRAQAQLSGRYEGELARSKRNRPLRTLAARLTALRAPLPENPNGFSLLCAQAYAYTGHRSSFVDFQQCRASLQPVKARQGGSASFSGRPARATACHSVRSERRSLHRVRYACSRWRAIYLWPSASTV